MSRSLPVLVLMIMAPAPCWSMGVPGVIAEPCFTLTAGQDCAAMAVREIDRAEQTLLVQAYNFTEPSIVHAIINAGQRGVRVTVVLDKISPHQPCAGADAVLASGIPVWIDHRPKIAHNKVLVIDRRDVVTGSFNFSTSAETANAENLVVLHSQALAEAFAVNFANRLKESVPYDGSHPKPVRRCARDDDQP